MRRLFGKKKQEPPAPTLDQTSERLGLRSAAMDKEVADLNAKLRTLAAEAKLPQNRTRVPLLRTQMQNLLKRRSLIQQNQQRLEGARFNIDNIAFQQEQIQTNIQVAGEMAAGAKLMKKQMKKINIDGVDDTMMDMDDLMADANEIGDILSTAVGTDYLDEGECDAELDALLEADDAVFAPGASTGLDAAEPDLSLPDFLNSH
jgi:charged multivesicular body protein 5